MAVIINNNLSNSEYSSNGIGSPSMRNDSYGISSRANDRIVLNQGNTISGEVISKDGNQITLKLSGDRTLSARLDGNADISVGQKLTFEVAKTGNNQTALRPLYANLSANSAVTSALKAAMLPINDTTVAFTDAMMQEGMPINKNALLSMARSVAAFPDNDPKAIVQMNKIGIPMDINNVSQFENYMNFKHQIVNDIDNIADGLSRMIQNDIFTSGLSDYESGNVINEILNLVDTDVLEGLQASQMGTEIEGVADNAGSTINNILNDIVQNSVENVPANLSELNLNDADTVVTQMNSESLYNANLSLSESEQQSFANTLNDILNMSGMEELTVPLNPSEVIETVKILVNDYITTSTADDGNVAGEVLPQSISENNTEFNDNVPVNDNIIDSKSDNPSVAGQGNNEVQNVSQDIQTNSGTSNTFLDSLKNSFNNILGRNAGNVLTDNNIASDKVTVNSDTDEAATDNSIRSRLEGLLKSESFGKLFSDSIKAQWTISPGDVKNSVKIDDMYERIYRQSAKINELMNSIGKGDSVVAKAATNVNNNVTFMNQINEFMGYVQLPLKMSGEEAHGDLYVYTRKKNLENNDGNFSALLHLDMDHLGPMDVYVAMQNHTKVNTHFYLQTPELLDFIESHIDELTQRLSSKGYDASVNVSEKADNGIKTPITDEFVKEEGQTSSNFVAKFCFDVRA